MFGVVVVVDVIVFGLVVAVAIAIAIAVAIIVAMFVVVFVVVMIVFNIIVIVIGIVMCRASFRFTPQQHSFGVPMFPGGWGRGHPNGPSCTPVSMVSSTRWL